MARKRSTQGPRTASAAPGARQPAAGPATRREAGGPAAEVSAAGAALLVVDEGRGVVRSSGWDRLFGTPVPERIPAPASGDEDDELLGAIARALEEADRSGEVAHAYVVVSLDRKRRYAVSAGRIGHNGGATGGAHPRNGGGRVTAVLVDDISDSFRVSPAEGEVVRQLAHDLRTPLTSLGGAVELMQSGRLGAIRPEHERLLTIMQKGIDLMLTRINEAAAPYRRDTTLQIPGQGRPPVT
jgi:signal transduction histidine kinase